MKTDTEPCWLQPGQPQSLWMERDAHVLVERGGVSITLPPDVVSRLQQETANALKSTSLRERMLAQGAIPSGMSSAAFTRLIASETRKWAKVVKASGARAE